MKIRIVTAPPIGKEHGVIVGREYTCTEKTVGKGRGSHQYWIIGDTGEDVRLFAYEFEVIADAKESNDVLD